MVVPVLPKVTEFRHREDNHVGQSVTIQTSTQSTQTEEVTDDLKIKDSVLNI